MASHSSDEIVEEYLTRWQETELPAKMPKPELLANGSQVELIKLVVYESHRRRGYANTALRLLTDLCDEMEGTLVLVAKPTGTSLNELVKPDSGPDQDQLVRMYEKHGFVKSDKYYEGCRELVRLPRVRS